MTALIDIQVNGGGDVLFNDAPDLAAIEAICAAHRRCGTDRLLVTLITDSHHHVAAAIDAAEQGLRARVPGHLGLHLEGPWLSPERPGVHPPEWLRPPPEAEVARIAAAARRFRRLGGRLLVTLAPEVTGPAPIAALAKAGAIVCAGHTAAGPDAMRAAVAAGLTGVTHLFNAMPPIAGRAPGPAGYALAHRLYAGLIADGHHLDPASLALAFRALGRKAILVSDAMPPAGGSGRPFTLCGRPVRVERDRCVDGEGRLAGAALPLAVMVERAVAAGIPDAAARHAATIAPARLLRLPVLGLPVFGKQQG